MVFPVTYCDADFSVCSPGPFMLGADHFDNTNGPGGPFKFVIKCPARPLLYLDQKFCDRLYTVTLLTI